jgi:Ulp1 family protease
MVFPVASNGHWFCVSIDIDERRITQYDSYNVSLRRSFVYSLCRWLSDKSARDNGESNRIATDQWELCVDYVPEQTNTFDCGPITACVCRSLALGLPFDFKEEDMPYKRCEIALSMLRYTCRH